MYYLKKRLEVAGSHFLALPYDSKCKNLHGHNWIITVYCKTDNLVNGMVVDFTKIKEIVMKLDHSNLNDIMVLPTAENIAEYLQKQIPCCYKIEVQESEGNIITYEV